MGRRHHKPKRSPEPRDVLAGRVELKPAELIELIHRVNPTGRELDAAREAERYRQKAELQSLLIRQHGDEHLVVTPAEDEGVVSLSHRSASRDACHAVLDELDPDARAWVRRHLDLAASGDAETAGDDALELRDRRRTPPAASASGPAESPEELLATAEEALGEYDYDRAERCLRQAFDASGGALPAARPLLTFLADQLGQDDAVLALEGRLEPAAASHPDLRTILALAAARQGDTDGAVRRVTGITDHPRLADVEAALAAAALGRGDAETAVRHRDALTARDPGHPRLAALERELAALRARGRQAAEEDLERRYRDAGPEAVEPAARDLLDRWGESDLARRILREVAAAHREKQVADHLERGENELAEGRFDDAARHFQAALDAGCQDDGLPGKIADLRELARLDAEAERLAAVVARFPPTADAAPVEDTTPYLAYLDLPPQLRREARETLGLRRLELLEEALPAESLSGAKAQALVAGVLALEHARTLVDRGEGAAALDELTPHLHVLRALDEARRLEEEARAQLAAAKRDAAAAQLREAGDAFSAGDLEAARRNLDTLALTDLHPDERQRAETLRQRLERAERSQRLEREAAQHEAAGDFFGALERTRQLADDAEDEDVRRRWQERSAALEESLRQAWRIEVSEDAAPLAEQHDVIPDPARASELAAWLDDEGHELVLPSCWGDELFVRVVDVESRTVRRQISLRLPCALGLAEAVRDGDRLLVAGEPGVYLELGLPDARILTWRRLDKIVPPRFRVEKAQPLPGGRFLWLRLAAVKRASEKRVLVIDTQTFRVARRLEKTEWFTVLLGDGEPRVLCDDAVGCRIYSDRGALVTRESVEGHHTGFAASGPPRGESLFSLLLAPSAVLRNLGGVAEAQANGAGAPPHDGEDDGASVSEEDPERSVLLARLEASPDGARMKCSSMMVLDADEDGTHAVASDLRTGLSFVLLQTPEDGRELVTLDASQEQPHIRSYEIDAPFETVLLRDRRSRHVAALSRCGDSLDLHRLGSEPPPWKNVAAYPSRLERWFPQTGPPFYCGYPPLDDSGSHLEAFRNVSPPELEDTLQHVVADMTPDDAAAVLSLLLAWKKGWLEPVGKSIHQLAAQHPRHFGTLLLQAEHRAMEGRWTEARSVLETLPLWRLGTIRRCHARHLLGLSWLFEGQTKKARKVFRRALYNVKKGAFCPIPPLYDLVRPMKDPPRPKEWGPSEPFVRQLLGAVRTADAALRAGDPEAARRAIDHPIVWRMEELQSAARLASVYLDTPASKPGERFRKRLALAFFRHLWAREPSLLRRELPLPDLRWDRPRLEDLARRSAEWLAGD